MKFVALLNIIFVVGAFGSIFHNTCDRIAEHGYPCESHVVQTNDGYKLTMFRIPYSHKLNNQQVANKSAVLIMHGLFCSSDTWVLSGPQSGLPFLLADAGYDVWLGNNRGNSYSQKHVSKSSLLPSFWGYSIHEIGVSDVPAKIDFIRSTTGQDQIHYVGHSQGGTAYMIMMSELPEYSNKIKSANLLSPAVYMEYSKWTIGQILGPLLDNPNLLGTLIGHSKFQVGADLTKLLVPTICKVKPIQDWCGNMLFLVVGGPSPYMNVTALPEFYRTHPDDISSQQLMHYIQFTRHHLFRQYDRGLISNLVTYGSAQPPSYNLNNVQPQSPMHIYYCDNDDVAAAADVEHLIADMGDRAISHHVKYPEFNHFDFLFATTVKEVINDCVLDKINVHEGKSSISGLCNSFID